MFVHLRVCLPTPSPPSVPCLIIISSCLCLPRSLMMTGMAGLPESQVPTLMSPCLTPLLSAQVSPHPCPSDLQRPRWLLGGWGAVGQSLKQRKGGIHCSLFSLHCLSLFMTSPAWPGTWRDPRGERAAHSALVTVTQAECCGSLSDYKTMAPLPITLRESAGWKFGWMRAITGSHARLDHEGWVMARFGNAGGGEWEV